MLLEQLKKDRMQAMKYGDTVKRSILSVLIGDIENKTAGNADAMTDAEIINMIKKYVKNNEDTMKHLGPNEDGNFIFSENEILMSYLPFQLTEKEIEGILHDSGQSNIGGMMNYLKTHYNGQFDGKTASKIAKELLG